MQIDDGYQADIGDWLTVNEKFPHGMQWLASEIKSAGYTPGLWLAPFLLAESSQTFAEHPDFVERGADGAPVVAKHNWERDELRPRRLAPGRAGVARRSCSAQVCDGWGYDYVKIDFLFGAALHGHAPRSGSDAYPRLSRGARGRARAASAPIASSSAAAR